MKPGRTSLVKIMGPLMAVVILLLASAPALAQAPTPTPGPERALSFTVGYNSIVVAASQTNTSIDVALANKGRRDESVKLSLDSQPAGWSVVFQDYSGAFDIWGVSLAAGDSKSLTMKIMPATNPAEGDYAIAVTAASADNVISVKQEVKVKIKKALAVEEKGVVLTTDYPVLRGSAGTKFQFKLDVANNTSTDRSFALGASVQPGWQVTFQPSYESTQISSLSLKSNASKGLDVFITAPKNAEPKEYQIALTAKDGTATATLPLKVEITGTYDLLVTTQNGILNTTATAGEEKHISLLVGNSGSAEIPQLTLLSSKPDGWVITFTPDKLNNVKSGALEQVDVSIKPAANAIAGDYSTTFTVSSDEVLKSVDIRVSVETATRWGWVGIGIVLAVMVIIGLAFMRLGRR